MAWEVHKIVKTVNIDEIYTLFIKEFEAGYNFTGEIHNFWECVYVINGEVCVSADDRIHTLSSGDIIFHKPLELHKFYITDKGPATLFIFSFSLEGAAKEKLSKLVCHLTDSQKAVINDMIEYCNYEARRSEKITNNDYYTFKPLLRSREMFGEMISCYITRLALLLSKEQKINELTITRDSLLFKSAVDCMKNNLSTPLSVKELAFKISVSESSLKRLFTKYAGMGIHKYFTTLKVKTATAMLEDGVPVGEVSEKLGFSSQAYFSVFYKRETGKNPSEV